MYEQDRVLVRLQQRILQDPDVVTCYLSGSFGRGSQDSYSDLDVVLVFEDEDSRKKAYSVRQQFVQSVLPYVPAKSFDATRIRPYFYIALYSNGTKVDYRYETKDTLKPTPWERDIRLLKDTSDWGKQYQAIAVSQQVLIPQPTIASADLEKLDNRFWVMFMDVYRQLLRGDHTKPYPIYLQLLNITIPELLKLLPTDTPSYQGLIQAHFNHDTKATAVHMRHLLQAFLDARDSVIKRHNLVYSADHIFEREITKAISKL